MAAAALLIVSSACAQNYSGSPTAPSTPQPVAGTAAMFAITGVVTEVAPSSRHLGGAQVQITSGPGAGTVATSDAQGLYHLPVPAGLVAIEARMDGYLLWRVSNLTVNKDFQQMDVVLYPVPPRNAEGASATARCNDGMWSWGASRAESCTADGGIAYTVCPSVLCNASSVQ